MSPRATRFSSVEEYIASFPEDIRNKLNAIRATIERAAPQARPKISYQIAAFALHGKDLVYFAGWKHHISMYPIPSGSETFQQELAPYVDGKGTLKFPLREPLPLGLIEKIVRRRVEEQWKDES